MWPERTSRVLCTSTARCTAEKCLPSNRLPYYSMYRTWGKGEELLRSPEWSPLLVSPLATLSFSSHRWEFMRTKKEQGRKRRTMRKTKQKRRRPSDEGKKYKMEGWLSQDFIKTAKMRKMRFILKNQPLAKVPKCPLKRRKTKILNKKQRDASWYRRNIEKVRPQLIRCRQCVMQSGRNVFNQERENYIYRQRMKSDRNVVKLVIAMHYIMTEMS